MQHLKTRVQIDKPDVIVVVETNVKHMRIETNLAVFNIPYYQMHTKNLSVENKRGIIIYTHNSLKNISEIVDDSEFEEYLSLVMITENKETLLICAIYRSESGSVENNDLLNDLLKEIEQKKCKHKLIVGDFNYKDICWKNLSTEKSDNSKEFKFLETIKYCYFTQHVDKPTRGRIGETSNILDLVITADPERIDEVQYLSPLGKSDHSVLLFDYTINFTRDENHKISYQYNRGNYQSINEDLNLNWEEKLEDKPVEDQWNIIKSAILQAQDKHVPIFDTSKQDKWKMKGSVPLNPEIRKEVRLKHRLWTRYYETGNPDKYQKYTVQRNKVCRLIETAQKDYEKGIGDNAKKNPKKLWAYVKLKAKTKTGIAPLIGKNKKKSTNELEQAEILSEYFAEVLEEEPEGEIPSLPPRPLKTGPLTDLKITIDAVEKKLSKIDITKSSGPDNLHSRLLKEAKGPIAKALTVIYNNSISTGEIPQEWRSAIITPIYKKGKKSDPGNYRPVSLTCVPCKQCESLIKDAIVEHMTINDLFSVRQYGFIIGRSTVLQLLKVLESWVNTLDEGGTIDDINLDFMKAFDKVPHRRLIYKMKQYGIEGNILRWVKNFLKDRVQRVNVSGHYSSEKKVLSGVPQGSVLGALLFVIYINDMPENISSDLFLFADDTKFFRPINTLQDSWTIQKDLHLLELWSNKWLLKFHPDKCVVLRISLNSEVERYTYRLFNKEVKYVTEVKDLGITVDQHLRFREHMYTKVNKANSIMGTIRRTFKYLNYYTFKVIYCAQVRTQVEYGSPVWSPYLKKDITLVENVQRRATKYLYGMKGLTYEERLKKLKLPTLSYRRLRGSMIEVYKIFHIYDKAATPCLPLSNLNTRGHNLKLYYSRSNKEHPKLHSFNQRVVHPWNSLPEDVVNSKNINTFKNRLDKHWENLPLRYSYLDFQHL